MWSSVATDPRTVAATRSAGHARPRTPTSLVRGLPARGGIKEGLPEAQRASQGSQRRNSSAIGDPRGPNSRRRDNAPRRTPVSTRVTGTGPFTLRSTKRNSLKRVVCYACYAFKVCRPCGVGPRAGESRWRALRRRSGLLGGHKERPGRGPALIIIYNTIFKDREREVGDEGRSPPRPDTIQMHYVE
jgi:hypothetical protein